MSGTHAAAARFRRWAFLPYLLILLLIHLLLWPALLRAQVTTADTASKVASVKFTGTSRFSAEALAQAIGLETGKIVTREDIKVAADRLAKLGYFEGISYEFHTTAKGVEIQFTVTEARCATVWFDNFPWFPDAELVRAIHDAGVLYDGTAPEGGTVLDAMREAIAGLLRSQNLPGEVEGEMVEAPESESMIERFRVVGADVRVTAVEFDNDVAKQDLRIAAVLDTLVGKPYSRYTLAIFMVEHVQPAYHSRGYLRARFGEPVALFSGDPGKPLGGAREVTVRVPVEPGVQYHWGGVTWDGQLALESAALISLTGFTAGEPADGIRIQGAWDRVAAEYARRGYLQAKLEPVARFDDAAARVSYAVKVTEGIQYRMGRLVITGLSLAAERQLLANWRIARGDIFDNAYFDAFVNGGAQKVFEKSPVHFQRVGHLLEPNAQTRTVDVKLDFQ
jgi:outer membrane protein assembly factor BamA